MNFLIRLEKRHPNLLPLIIIILGIVVYANSLINGILLDDFLHISLNALLGPVDQLPRIFQGSTAYIQEAQSYVGLFYRPLMTTSFFFINLFFGKNPFFYHLFQVAVHIANALLIFFLFSSFLKRPALLASRSGPAGRGLALFLSLIFLVHPINSESVVYISATQEVLFLFFGLLSFHVFRVVSEKKRKNYSYYLLGFLGTTFLLLSLLSKETGILFVAMIPVYFFLFNRKYLAHQLIFTILAIIGYAILRFGVAHMSLTFSKEGFSPIQHVSFFERLLHIPFNTFYYLKTFVFPKDLVMGQLSVFTSFGFIELYLPLIATMLIFGTLVLLGRELRRKNKNLFPYYLFFFLWFLVGLLFHLHILFPLDMTRGDRWFYFPMVGLLGMLGIIFTNFISIKKQAHKTWILLLCILIITSLSIRTIIRNPNWKNIYTLASHDIALSKDSFILEEGLGASLLEQGSIDEAKVHIENTTRLVPTWWVGWYELGIVYERKKDYKKAKEYLQKSIETGNFVNAYQDLAQIFLLEQNYLSAGEVSQRGVEFYPANPMLWRFLALSQYKLGDKKEALLSAKKSYELDPRKETYSLYKLIEEGKTIFIK